jgi:ABC-type Na+ efflux pump permease subunit
LFKRGYDYSEITGGINGMVQDDAFYVSATIQKSENKTYTTKKAVDLTNINTIFAKVYSPNTTADVYNRITVTAGAYNGSNVQTSNLKSYTQTTAPFTSPEQIVSLDVSTLKGAFYLGYTWGVLSSGSSKAVTGYVYEWWVE